MLTLGSVFSKEFLMNKSIFMAKQYWCLLIIGAIRFVVFVLVLEIESKALNMLSMHSTSKQQPQLLDSSLKLY